MLTNSPEINSIGGGFGGFGGGFGGGGILEGIILASLLGRGRGGLFGGDGDGGGCAAEAVILNAITGSERTTVAEGRALAAALCMTNDNIKDGNYAAAIQAERNTAQLSAQAQAFAIVADKTADEIKAAGVAQTAALAALINQNKMDDLRDQLHNERRRSDGTDIAINIANSNAQTQAQFQAQFQNLKDEQRGWFGIIGNQLNRTAQDITNFGTMTASGTQAASSINTK